MCLTAFILTLMLMMSATPSYAAEDSYQDAMDTMHHNMMITPSGNADVDFMRGMIPHHQGAIDMAKIVLEKGTDPEVRKLAEQVIEAQQSEIAFMQDWLKRNAPHSHAAE